MEQLSLIQLSAFRSNWKGLRLTDEDLRALEAAAYKTLLQQLAQYLRKEFKSGGLTP